MNYLNVSDLCEGQVFTHMVYIEEDTVFIPAGVPVRQKDIDRLKSWDIEVVQTEGVVKIGGSDDAQASVDSWGLATDSKQSDFYNKVVEKTGTMLKNIKDKVRVDEKTVEDIILTIVSKVEGNSIDTTRLILTNDDSSKILAKNAVDTSLLAVTVGLVMKIPRHKLYSLCGGALLHDVGMQHIPKQILDQNRSLKADEFKALKTHPLYSYRIISKELQLPEDIAQIALQHHERWDGKGYPQGLRETQILLEARIVSVVDGFEAMVSDRPWRDSMIGYEAARAILNDNQRRFDPEVVKHFIRVIGLYPVGSLVQISNGSIARVVRSSNEAPLRPEVIILIDENGKEFQGDTGPTIDLLTNRELLIAKALNSRILAGEKKQF